MSNKIILEGCPINFDIRDCPMSFQKQKSFDLKIVFFSYMAYCMLRELGEDLGQGS